MKKPRSGVGAIVDFLDPMNSNEDLRRLEQSDRDRRKNIERKAQQEHKKKKKKS